MEWMASLVIAALPVHSAATILLAATSKSPIKAATTDVREDDFLRLNVAFVSPAKYGDFKRSELSFYYGTSSTALISLWDARDCSA